MGSPQNESLRRVSSSVRVTPPGVGAATPGVGVKWRRCLRGIEAGEELLLPGEGGEEEPLLLHGAAGRGSHRAFNKSPLQVRSQALTRALFVHRDLFNRNANMKYSSHLVFIKKYIEIRVKRRNGGGYI